MGREPAVSIERVIAAPCATVFGLLSDTNRWDRLIGTSASRYTYELLDPSDPTSRTRIGHARLGPIRQHFADSNTEPNPNTIDPASMRRVDDSWSWNVNSQGPQPAGNPGAGLCEVYQRLTSAKAGGR